MNPAGPIETKVAASAASGMLAGVITWILTTYVPAFHSGLPPALASFLPYIITLVASTLSGYLAPHTSRPAVSAQPQNPAAHAAP
jgi:Na+/proline symporter